MTEIEEAMSRIKLRLEHSERRVGYYREWTHYWERRALAAEAEQQCHHIRARTAETDQYILPKGWRKP